MRERVVRAIGAEKKHIGLYLQALVKWLLLAAVTGGICGAVGAAFHIGIHEAELLRGRFPWLLWCLPLAGIAIVAFYKLTRTEGQGTNCAVVLPAGRGLPSRWAVPSVIMWGDCSAWMTGICVLPPWWAWLLSLPLCSVRLLPLPCLP